MIYVRSALDMLDVKDLRMDGNYRDEIKYDL